MADLLGRVGARLKHLRQERRLTQEQLAETAGLSYKFVGEIERGTGNPTLTTLGAIADALAVDVGDFFIDPNVRPRVSIRDVTVAREALESIEQFVDRASPTGKAVRYRMRRRKS